MGIGLSGTGHLDCDPVIMSSIHNTGERRQQQQQKLKVT